MVETEESFEGELQYRLLSGGPREQKNYETESTLVGRQIGRYVGE